MDKKTLRKKQGNNHDWTWYHKFCGITMSSNYYIFHLFSMILEENPQVERIIELGTGEGSMSIMLGLEGIKRDIKVITYDHKNLLTPDTKKILRTLKVKIIKADIFKEDILFDVPVYLLCDNGDKIKELETFVPMLKKGSVVSVHDWGMEISQKEIDTTGLTPFKKHLWNKHNVQLATWIVS